MNEIGIKEDAKLSNENSRQSVTNRIFDRGAEGGGGAIGTVVDSTEVRSGSRSVLVVVEFLITIGGWSNSESIKVSQINIVI